MRESVVVGLQQLHAPRVLCRLCFSTWLFAVTDQVLFENQIRKVNANTNRQIQKLESTIRLWAVWLPPIPALCVGLFVFMSRLKMEKRNVVASRRRDS